MRVLHAILLYACAVAAFHGSPLGTMLFYGSVSIADMLEPAVMVPALGVVMVGEGWSVRIPLLAGCVLLSLAAAFWRRRFGRLLLSAALLATEVAGVAGVAIMGAVWRAQAMPLRHSGMCISPRLSQSTGTRP